MGERTTQRLFFALWPDKEVRIALNNLVAELPSHGGRAVHNADLHITLIFLGQVAADLYPCVTEVANNIRVTPFQLKIDTVGYWKRPRILWCRPSKIPRQLTELVSNLQKGLQGCGFKPEKRDYTPHITLARKARSIGGYSLDHPITWNPGEFTLVTSDCSKRVPRYAVLRRWPLLNRFEDLGSRL